MVVDIDVDVDVDSIRGWRIVENLGSREGCSSCD